jgi:hypothetical protein
MKKPIHKFNGGIGATLCNKCNKIITESLTQHIYCEDCDIDSKPSYKYKLERSDGVVHRGNKIIWIEWNKDGTFKEKHDQPAIDRSLVLDFIGYTYTWMTTTVKEIELISENLIKFTTENSHYNLYTYE